MPRIGRCAAPECGIQTAVWGSPPCCIAHLGAFDHMLPGRRLLTDAQVLELRGLRAAGWSYERLALRYGVTPTCVVDIVKGRTYRDVLAVAA